ncbi:hypothetical protein HAX54_006327 [Datura stramonium]|uniref:Uncharacterized protein n=1 Tax=Datura stramonium TaxID=4076 RepID=A0ABS8WW17_DATST|nr:hypothetical protein [Datura stramonium]
MCHATISGFGAFKWWSLQVGGDAGLVEEKWSGEGDDGATALLVSAGWRWRRKEGDLVVREIWCCSRWCATVGEKGVVSGRGGFGGRQLGGESELEVMVRACGWWFLVKEKGVVGGAAVLRR